MTPTQAWAMQCAFVAARTNTSDFAEDEIRPLQRIATTEEFMKWTGFTDKREPIEGDLGVNKAKDTFVMWKGRWKPMSETANQKRLEP